MFKLLTYFVLSYLVYKYFIKPNFLPAGGGNPSNLKSKNKQQHAQEKEDEGDYIDYEEVD
ncbi:MAG: hypothetical protein NXI23_11765 [Bacteroidetes bacterium]|jgi:hypothetical protein|nr:hypothetical protein [Bacteroidota bacterium]MDF1865729.1 hypothetical protein [Saprospiraceae bacterium]